MERPIQRRRPAGAGGARRGAARREAATGQRAERRGYGTGDTDEAGAAFRMAGQQRLRVRVQRTVEQRGRGAGFHRLPGIDDGDIVAELGDDAEVVGDEEHRNAEIVHQLPQQPQDLLLGGDVERRGRFVRDHQARGAGERRGDQQPLPLAAGELVRVAVQRRRRIGQLHAAEQVQQPGAMGAAVARSVPAHRFQQLRTDGEERVQREVGVLRNEADAAATHTAV